MSAKTIAIIGSMSIALFGYSGQEVSLRQDAARTLQGEVLSRQTSPEERADLVARGLESSDESVLVATANSMAALGFDARANGARSVASAIEIKALWTHSGRLWELAEVGRSATLRHAALMALGNLELAVAPYLSAETCGKLIGRIADQAQVVRTEAAKALALSGESNEESCQDALIVAVRSTDQEVARLGASGIARTQVVRGIGEVAKLLEATEPLTRTRAAVALAAFGPRATASLDALRQAAALERDEKVWQAIQQAITLIERR